MDAYNYSISEYGSRPQNPVRLNGAFLTAEVCVKRFLSVFLLMGGLLAGTSVMGATVLGTGAATSICCASFGAAFWQGFQFTTGSQSASLNSINLAIKTVTTGMTWRLYLDNGGGTPAPGATALATETTPSATYANYTDGNAATLSTITFSGALASYQLAPNTRYVLIFSLSNAGNWVYLSNNPITSTEGWSSTTVRVLTADSGANWTGTQIPFIFNLNATSAPASIPTPAPIPTLSEWAQLLLGLMVMTVIGWHFHRERSY